MIRSWALTEDLPFAVVVGMGVLALASLLLLVFEQRRRERHGALILATGVLSLGLGAAAVLRPVRVTTRGSVVGPRVVVLVDDSRRLLLPERGTTRRKLAARAVDELRARFSEARLSVLGFGGGAPAPFSPERSEHLGAESDLVAALAHLAESPGERPKAVVVVSDGRLTRPAADSDDAALRRAIDVLGAPVHTLRVAERAPPDASIRAVRAAGVAVAHQPLALTVEIGCSGGLDCENLPVTVRELRHRVEPAVLASGVARMEDGRATVELPVTLERAGPRVLEVAIDAPDGDAVPANDRRISSFFVTRERIRLLHVAGRPTYDVRALRLWLKGDESVDLVAFFILRTDRDDPSTIDDSELALIPFPVTELFTEHLPSFDAVILQDIDAVTYKLEQHLPALARYVKSGGGLIMVGGPSSFSGGGYAGTDLEHVLPTTLPDPEQASDTAELVPRYTEAGSAAPILAPLRDLLGTELPSMSGSNTLGPARSSSLVLWEHPNRRASDHAMPVLALGEAGDGRSIALSVDATYELGFSEVAARVAGRAFGALWDGLLGWLMRDQRYEAARVELVGDCIAGELAKLRVHRLPGMEGAVQVSFEKLAADSVAGKEQKAPAGAGPVDLEVGPFDAGGWTARVQVGKAPPTRFDFACEQGGEAWSDSRPDPARLERIAAVSGGKSVGDERVEELPLPAATQIAAERHVSPVLPAWLWALGASLVLGVHWLARRRGGLA